MKKIGIGCITCNRPEFFKKCIDSIPENIGDIVVVNDGQPYSSSSYPDKIKEVIQHTINKNVGISKNEALRWMIQKDCSYLFLIEDDMIIKKSDVFEKYINTAAKSGLFRLSYGYHGPANKTKEGKPNPREIIDYGDGIEVAFNLHSVGSFCLFHKGIIKNIGYMDERYQNCWEHICFDTKIVERG